MFTTRKGVPGVTWQEQLRRLDEDFSSGRISAEHYRVQRDQILASAASPQAQNPQGDNSAEATQFVQPAGQQGPDGATQIVRPGGGDAPDGATQIVQPQQANGWGTQEPQQEEALWGGDQFPPIAPPTDDEDWVTQGPEDEGTGGKKHTGLIIGAVVGVLLIAGIVVGAIFLFKGDGDSATEGNKAPASTAPPTSGQAGAPADSGGQESAPPSDDSGANDALAIGKLPGKVEAHPEVKTFQDILKQGYLNDDELKAYNKAEAANAKYQVQHLPDGTIATVLVTSVHSGKDAAAAVKSLAKVQTANGAKKDANAPKGVLVTDYTDKKMGQVRGHYVSGNLVVRVESTNKTKGLAPARKDFGKVLDAQLKALVADGS